MYTETYTRRHGHLRGSSTLGSRERW